MVGIMRIVINKKGYLYRLVFLILIVMTLIACRGGSTTREKIDDKENKLFATIRIWCSERSKESIKNSVMLFKQKYPKLVIEVTALSEKEIQSKLNRKDISDDDFPHIIEIGSYDIANMVESYPDFFVPVDSIMENRRDKFLSWKLEEMTYEEKIYAFPWDIEPKILIYNRKLAKEYNISTFDIKTWLEFSNLGFLIKKQTSNNLKLIALKENVDGNLYKSMLRQFRKGLYSKGNYINLPEENKKVLSTIRGMYSEGMVYTLKKEEDPLEVLKEGKVLCILGDSSDVSRLNRETEFKDFQWEVQNLPAFEYGGKRMVYGEGNALMLTKKSESNNGAVEFLNFLLTDSESVTYSLKEAGIIPSIPILYNLSEFNINSNNYQNMKLWRFMAEQSKEEEALLYDHRYEVIEKQLIQMEQAAIEGRDIETLITTEEKELNKMMDVEFKKN